MRTTSFLLAGACAFALAAPAMAAPGQCFDAAGQPTGPVYDTETPDTAFMRWVQNRGGECRALRAEEVRLNPAQPRAYPREYRTEIEVHPPAQVSPSAPPLPRPPAGTVVWEGDPALAQRLIVAYYQPRVRDVTVVDTGQVLYLENGGQLRLFEMTYGDGSRRTVGVQVRPDSRYVLVERDGSTWGQTIYLQE